MGFRRKNSTIHGKKNVSSLQDIKVINELPFFAKWEMKNAPTLKEENKMQNLGWDFASGFCAS
ncbi:MAG: hypothetical protein GY822_05965 [Deltaproteobacteria bacterium]|nr:hypothetical protein [Deltaproteobacteria bacterium]